MDPLAAFGLTCNVLQILSFGHEALSLCRRICRDGSPEPDLSYNSARLQNLSKKLLESINATQTSNKLSKEQQDLQHIASRLMDVTTQLGKLIEEVTVDGPPRRRAAVANTMKYLLQYKGKIQSLEKAMVSFQNTLNSGTLAHLCSTSEASALQSRQDFSKLDHSLQHFIQQYARGNQTVTALISRGTESIREHVSAECANTRSQLAANIQDLNLNASTADRYNRFLGSLKYDEMNARRNAITTSHEKTFKWIFDDSDQGPWDSFVHWLKSSDKNFYWISGKAGSGKSTLIKFIIDNDAAKKVLSERNPNTTIISFFFWNSGTKMQRSIAGMLCSLLHQVFRDNMKSLVELLRIEPLLSYKESISDWSLEELQQAVLQLFSDRTYSYCLSIDGLDEVEHTEGQVELVRILDKIRCQPNIKLCVSSRPEPILQESLKAYPKLRLQDLTIDDIRQYVTDVLGPIEKVMKSDKGESKSSLIDQISKKADGVFLWVKLVAKSLQTGVTNADDWDILMKRVDRLPRDIDRLYNHMWSRLNEDQELYRSKAATHFKFVLRRLEKRPSSTPSLFELMVASEKSLDDQVLDEDSNELVRLCRAVEKRLTVRCAGLLEVVWGTGDTSSNTTIADGKNDQETTQSELKDLSTKTQVSFIHRSAREFLRETEAGRQILSYCSKSDEESWSDLIRATIAQETLSEPNKKSWSRVAGGTDSSERIMQSFLAGKEALSEQTEFRLLDLYRKTLQQGFESINNSIAFLCLAARFGHYAYVRLHFEQLESLHGRIPTETKTRLLHSASTWIRVPYVWIYHFAIERCLEKITLGKNELISWLLENGADPNLTVVGMRNERETPFASILKQYFLILDWPSSSWRDLKEQMSVGLQRFFEFAGDLRSTALLYYYKNPLPPHDWRWTIHCPTSKDILEKPLSWIIVIQINCSWLTSGVIAKREENKYKNEDHILALRCNNVEPKFKVLQVFFEDEHLQESGLDTFFEANTSNLVGSLQDRLKLPNWSSVGEQSEDRKSPEDRITATVEELYKHHPGRIEETIQDWMIKEGYRSANENDDG